MKILNIEAWEEKFGEDIFAELEEHICEMDISQSVKNTLVDSLDTVFWEVLEYRYEQYCSETQDRAYEEYRDNKMMGED